MAIWYDLKDLQDPTPELKKYEGLKMKKRRIGKTLDITSILNRYNYALTSWEIKLNTLKDKYGEDSRISFDIGSGGVIKITLHYTRDEYEYEREDREKRNAKSRECRAKRAKAKRKLEFEKLKIEFEDVADRPTLITKEKENVENEIK